MKRQHKLGLTALTIALVTACGGGGGGDGNSVTPNTSSSSSLSVSSSSASSNAVSLSSSSAAATSSSSSSSSNSSSSVSSASASSLASNASSSTAVPTASTPSTGGPETATIGYGKAVTGAGSNPGKTVTVSSLAEMQAEITAYNGTTGLLINYNGTFDFSTITDPCTQRTLPAQLLEIKWESKKVKENITIQGADGSAANFGIAIKGPAKNIIIRNMTIGLIPGGGEGADIVSAEGNSTGSPSNIWIDHNTFFTSMKECSGAGDSEFDGMLDFKKGANNITVSYNHLHDHHKMSLNGYTDTDSETADGGTNPVRHITFHHNIFENIGSRAPLQRGGYSHMLNNLFSSIETSGINVRMGGYSLVEGNYFENVQNPVTSRDSDAIGYWELRNNNITSPSDFATYGIKWVASASTPTKDATDWTTTAIFPVARMTYTYTPQAPACIKAGLRTVAGAGKNLATLVCN